MGPSSEAVHVFVGGLAVGEPFAVGALALAPVLSRSGTREPGYLTLDEAIERREVVLGDADLLGMTSVALRVLGDTPVLVPAGELLVGGRQDRIVSATVLARPRVVTAVPVSCVERGRWSPSGEAFRARGLASSTLRSLAGRSVTRCLRTLRGYASDPAAVWSGVEREHRRARTASRTGALAVAHEARRRQLRDLTDALAPRLERSGAVGLVAFSSGTALGADVFDSACTLGRLAPNLVASYAADADAVGRPASPRGDLAAASRFLGRASSGARVRRFASRGLGADLRIEGNGVGGSALAHGERILHLALFPEEPPLEP